jgi:N-acyl homoserine lactone hydrolase
MKKNLCVPLLFALIAAPAMAQPHKAQPPKSVRLYVFDCGTLDIPDTSPYGFKKEELASAVMSAPCFLVAHPKGTLMWDTALFRTAISSPAAAQQRCVTRHPPGL